MNKDNIINAIKNHRQELGVYANFRYDTEYHPDIVLCRDWYKQGYIQGWQDALGVVLGKETHKYPDESPYNLVLYGVYYTCDTRFFPDDFLLYDNGWLNLPEGKEVKFYKVFLSEWNIEKHYESLQKDLENTKGFFVEEGLIKNWLILKQRLQEKGRYPREWYYKNNSLKSNRNETTATD